MNIKKLIFRLLVVSMMFMILSFSSDTATVSKSKSMMIVEKIKPIVKVIADELEVKPISTSRLDHYVRKAAHMFNYFVLTIVCFLAFRAVIPKFWVSVFLTWLLATCFSMIDEYYQTFIPGRGGQVRDVFIDSIGIIIALVIICIIRSIRNKYRSIQYR